MFWPAVRVLLAGLSLHVSIVRPAAAQAPISLRPVMRIGGADSGAYAFTDIRGLTVGNDGRLFVLDHSTQDIRVFDSDGRFVFAFARRGAGPGELGNANGLLLVTDTVLWAQDPSNARFAVFSTSGQYIGQHRARIASYGYLWEPKKTSSGLILNPSLRTSSSRGRERFLERLTSDGSIRDSITVPSCPQPRQSNLFDGRGASGQTVMQIPFSPRPHFALGPATEVWCSSGDQYVIVKFDLLTGKEAARIQSVARGPRVSQEERGEAVEHVRRTLGQHAELDATLARIPSEWPPIMAVDVDDESRVWVRRYSEKQNATIVDVWTSEGRKLAEFEIPFRIHPYQPLRVWRSNIYAVVLDEDEGQHIVRLQFQLRR